MKIAPLTSSGLFQNEKGEQQRERLGWAHSGDLPLIALNITSRSEESRNWPFLSGVAMEPQHML